MPTYLTRCEDCKREETVIHSMADDHPNCENCNGKLKTIHRSIPPVHLKGDGWASKEIREERQESKAFK